MVVATGDARSDALMSGRADARCVRCTRRAIGCGASGASEVRAIGCADERRTSGRAVRPVHPTRDRMR